MQRNDAALILFTLSPETEGRRKPLGPARRTAEVFAALIDHVEGVAADLDGVDLLVASPRSSRPRRGRHLPQRGSDFGQALGNAVGSAFDLGYRRVVVIGNDAPEITAAYLRGAFRSLTGSGRRSVLGASPDGGYALLGLNEHCRAAFQEIRWGSRRVAAATRERLRREAFRLVELEPVNDIDTAADLVRFMNRAARGGMASLLDRLRRILSSPHVPTAAPRPVSRTHPASRPPLRAPPGLACV